MNSCQDWYGQNAPVMLSVVYYYFFLVAGGVEEEKEKEKGRLKKCLSCSKKGLIREGG